jgi:hypothetical protein
MDIKTLLRSCWNASRMYFQDLSENSYQDFIEKNEQVLSLFAVINWVAVKDKLPLRPDEDYLVVMRNKNKEGGIALQDIKNFTSDGTWVGGNNWEDVVAWAELPKPPCL